MKIFKVFEIKQHRCCLSPKILSKGGGWSNSKHTEAMNNDTQNLEQQRGFYRKNSKEEITVVVII